eukprot:TRINITY_DN3988_c0_g1_i6.p1 TRINITY_DN3988_c0_g1~~TRINITY_DN3988_c0_g1_i6.p1  ORF type:complete len:533 (-),score=143.67 TRINITY_DN3988_c0_g1_i6:96-1694(-)
MSNGTQELQTQQMMLHLNDEKSVKKIRNHLKRVTEKCEELQKELQSQLTTVQDLRRMLNFTRTLHADTKIELDMVKKENDELKENVLDYEKQLSKVELVKQQFTKRLEDVKRDWASNSEAYVNQIVTIRAVLENKIREAQKDSETKMEQITILLSEKEDLMKRIELITGKKELLESKLTLLSNRLKSLVETASDCNALTQLCQQESQENVPDEEKYMRIVEKSMNVLIDRERNSITNNNNSNNDQSMNQSNNTNNMEDHSEESQISIKQLQERIDALANENETLNKQNKEYVKTLSNYSTIQQKLDDLNAEFDKTKHLKDKVISLTSQLESSTKESGKLSQELKQTQQRLGELIYVKDKLEELLRKMNEEYTSLYHAYLETPSGYEKKYEHKQNNDRITQLHQSFQNLQPMIPSTSEEAEAYATTTKTYRLASDNASLTQQLDALKPTIDSLTKERDILSQELQQIKKKLDKQQQDSDEMKTMKEMLFNYIALSIKLSSKDPNIDMKSVMTKVQHAYYIMFARISLHLSCSC